MADDLCDTEWWEKQSQDANPTSSRKRTSNVEKEISSTESVVSKKKQKKLRPKKDKQEASESTTIDADTLWNFFIDENKNKLSKIELEEIEPKDSQFISGSHHPASLENLSQYLNEIIPNWETEMKSLKEKDKGCPLILVISSSAKRSVELLRAMKDFKSSQCKAAKLFAKHFKLEDQEAFLNKSLVHIGVGTPNRILKLQSDGFLKLKRLKYLVIDWSFQDAKKRKLVDIPEIKADFLEILQKELLLRIKQKKVKYSMF